VKEMFCVGAFNAHAAYHTHVCDFKTFYIICEVIFPALGYYGKFVDLGSWRYKSHYTFSNRINFPRLEGRFQCVVKTGRKYQILSK